MDCSQETAAHGTGTGGPVRYNPCQRAPGIQTSVRPGRHPSENGYYVNPPEQTVPWPPIVFPMRILICIRTHFRKINQMSVDADMESRRTSEIMEWFSSNYTAEEIDHVSGADSEPSMEQRYLSVPTKLPQLLHAKFAGLPEDYEEHILEKIYAAYYSDTNE